ncbi:efflux RND transporter periplasmic adaptor subunit [Candidatus Methylocalor cossyra]|uniref:Co/Zn/Cd efflux system membrane fusion protein n=1 Tax=Candidatus Methylocalor cossyra TaxID=3108543 RepID=A0ABP1CC38_9GAMM
MSDLILKWFHEASHGTLSRGWPKKMLFRFGVIVLCAALVVAWLQFRAPSVGLADGGDKTPITAAVARVQRENLTKKLDIAAEFQPFQEVDVHAKVAGYVKQLNVDIGDRVTRGQVLATLEVPELQEDYARAKAAISRFRGEIAHAQSQIKRYEAIARQADVTYRRLASVNQESPNLVAQQEIDIANAQAQAAAAQVAAEQANRVVSQQKLAEAEAKLRRVQDLLDYSRVTAPFSGIVTKRYVSVGTMVQIGTASNTQALPVVRVSQVDQLRLVFPVPESAMAKVQPGAAVTVTVPALGKSFDARVWRYAASADDATRTMETQVLVENPSFELKPGMLASVGLVLEHSAQALTVPLEAVADSTTHPTVWVVTPDKRIEERQVTLGLQTATRYEVLSGLSENEQVIVAGRDRLKVGEAVEPKLIALE